jgi:hypothetical protein
MKILRVKRSMAVSLFSASILVSVGCTAARKTSSPLATAPDPAPAKKEYQWKDMSQGKAFYPDSKPTPDQ